MGTNLKEEWKRFGNEALNNFFNGLSLMLSVFFYTLPFTIVIALIYFFIK